MILDASALIDAVVDGPRAPAVRDHVSQASFLAAPELLLVEATAVVWRLVRTGALSANATESASLLTTDARLARGRHGVSVTLVS